ncbi:MAG: restriction endonuclease subunit S [Bdellovibrionota bacterium]
MVECPKGWDNSKLGNLLKVETGVGDLKDSVKGGKYPFYVRSQIIQRLNTYSFDCEAVLTAGDGEIGKIFHYIEGKFSAHQRVYVISGFTKTKEQAVLGKYFYYWFSYFFYNHVMKYTAKSTVNSIRREMITDMYLPLPPIKEQQAIADTLSTFDKHIENLTELIKKKKAIRDGALEDLLTGKVRVDGAKGEWEEGELSTIAKVYDGTHQTPIYTNKGVPFVSVENINNLNESGKHISEIDFARDFPVYPEFGDILMTRIGDIGTPAIVTTKRPIAYYVSLALLKNIRINSVYLKYHILSSSFKKELDEKTLHHATPIKINKNEIGKCLVSFPKSFKEQQAIASILSSMDKELECLEKEKAKDFRN